MPAQTFTLTNTGTTTSQLDRINFGTPAGLTHIADLTNFGGPANFTGTSFTVTNPSLAANQAKTFTLDYVYVSGSAGARNGNVTVFYVGGQSCAAQTTINVSQATPVPAPVPVPVPVPVPAPVPVPVPVPVPAPVPTVPVTLALGVDSGPNPGGFQPGESLLYTAITTGLPIGTTLYWKILETGGTPPTNFVEMGGTRAPITDFVATSGSFQVSDVYVAGLYNYGSFNVSLKSTASTDRQWFAVQIGTQPGATGITSESSNITNTNTG